MSLNGPGDGNRGCDMVLTSRLERLYGSTDDEKGVGGMSGRVSKISGLKSAQNEFPLIFRFFLYSSLF